MLTTILIPSATDPAKTYTVTLGPRSSTCECPDYLYRRADKGEACRHIRQAEKQQRAEQFAHLAELAGTVADAELPKLIEKYRAAGPAKGAVLVALLGEQFDREQLSRMPAPPPVFHSLDAVLVRARNFGRELAEQRLKAIFA